MEFLQLKFEEGLIAETEVFKMNAQIASEEVSLITSVNSVQLYYLDLNQILNLPLSTVLYLQPLDLDALNAFSQQLLPLNIEEIYVTDPNFILTKIREKREELNVKLAKAAYLPTLNLQVNYGSFYSNSNRDFNFNAQWNNNKNYGFGFALSIPVLNGYLVRSNVRKAKINQEQGWVKSAIEKNRLIKVLTKANYDVATSLEKFKSASSALRYSEKIVEADQLKFEYGKISLTELLLVQKEYSNNQAEWIKAKYEHIYNLAVIRFYRDNDFSF